MSVVYGPTQQQPQQTAQQHPPPMPPNQQRIMPPNNRGPAGMPPPPPSTAHIQKILDDNCGLIQTIQDFQNLGKMNECMSYHQALHRNLVYLVYLAQLADVSKNISEILPPPHVMQGPPPGTTGFLGGSGVTSPSQIPPSHHPNEPGKVLS